MRRTCERNMDDYELSEIGRPRFVYVSAAIDRKKGKLTRTYTPVAISSV